MSALSAFFRRGVLSVLALSAVGFFLVGAFPQATRAYEPIPPIKLSQPVSGVGQVSDLGQYLALIYRYAIGISAVGAIVMVIYGAFRYLFGSAVGDVSSGQQTIKDAIIGMLLVLGAYTLLATVNPNTLSLKLPAIKAVENIKLKLEPRPEPAAASTQQNFIVATTTACSQDSGCSSLPAGKCLLTAVSGIAGHGGSLQGSCTAGAVGQRCRCAGTGCQLISDQGALAGVTVTNNNWTGVVSCQNQLKCVFMQGQTEGWFCQNVPVRHREADFAAVRGAVSHANCFTDQECGAGRHCIRYDPTSNNADHRGECSSGQSGERCRCAGWGCGSGVAGVAQSAVACQTGLECQLFDLERPYDNNGEIADWFCAHPAP